MMSENLIAELGLLRLVPKKLSSEHPIEVVKQTLSDSQQKESPKVKPSKPEKTSEKIDKNEFRLLVKMLQAIKHDCQYDLIIYDGTFVKYKLPKLTLVFNDITLPDSEDTINLSSLADLISNPQLKRPVWEKLKTIKV